MKFSEPLLCFASILLGLNIIYTAYWMNLNHPYQYVYFNILAGKHADYSFERDYWGLTVREGLEFIVDNDDREFIKVFINVVGNASRNISMLKPEDQKRIVLVEEHEAEYFVESYRIMQGNYWKDKEIYSVEVDNTTIMSVFDLRNTKGQVK